MITRNKLVFEIFEILRSFIADDDDLDSRQLEEFVRDYRADFLKQRFDKDPFDIDASCIQNIEGLVVNKEDSSSLSGSTSERYLMRTNLAIPNTVRRKGMTGSLLHIGSADKLDSSFTITNYATAIESGHGRFNRDEIFAFPYNGYIYLYSRGDDFKTIYHINIQGVFADPAEAYLVTNDGPYTGDENYYTPEDLKRYITTSILKDKYGILINPPVDEKIDADHNLEVDTQVTRR